MTKVKITIKGAFDLRAASLHDEELVFVRDTAEADVADGDHILYWQIRGQPGSKFTVSVEPGRKEPVKREIPESGEDRAQFTVTIPEPKKKDAPA